MIAKICLTTFLGIGLLYVRTQADTSRLIRYTLYLIVASGMYFVWHPNHSTIIANFLGIGRGADLIFYTWMMFSAGVLLNIHLKLRKTLKEFTNLTRYIALMNPVASSEQEKK